MRHAARPDISRPVAHGVGFLTPLECEVRRAVATTVLMQPELGDMRQPEPLLNSLAAERAAAALRGLLVLLAENVRKQVTLEIFSIVNRDASAAQPPAAAPPQSPVQHRFAGQPGPTDPSSVEPVDGDSRGITELVMTVLRTAAAPLTLPQITEEVRRLNPRYTAEYVKVILYRQQRRNGGAVVRQGAKGQFLYSLRSRDTGSDEAREGTPLH